MKRFLYLNNDTLSSYISQIDNGLIKSITESTKKDITKEHDIKSSIDADASVNMKILGSGADANVDASIEDDNKKINTDSHYNSTEKASYDETYEKFENYLLEENLINEKGNIGDFVKLDKEMFIVDLEYYRNIFSNKNVLDSFINDEVQTRYNNEVVKVEEGGKKTEYDKDKLFKKIKKEVTCEYEAVSKNIDLILNIIPYNKFGIMGEYLISFDDAYFRDKTKVVAFKYGGKMTLLGYLTNTVTNNTITDDTNFFNTFPAIINSFMLTFFHKNEIKIIHPIAIYY